MALRNLLEIGSALKRPLTEKVSLERARWFDRHILPHEPCLCAWLRRRRLDPHEVSDVVQESYAILAARERLDDLHTPRAYLFRIAHSLVLRDERRARIVPFESLESVVAAEPVDALSPERIAVARDEVRRLAIVLRAMPARVRAAFVMRRVHGLSQREIAERMRISESTVEKHIAKGVSLVMEWSERQGGDRGSGSYKRKSIGNGRLNAGSRSAKHDQ
ncbi:RNA polymerase sigma factor [Sphingomonas morindae]|uniref:RNA polymerase sigma factor n=1 Tax=Sphingomonas morindae TaxID=1541170 RepID=A0ABY4XCP6_9SPHN|nr:RNA polymerase sigma factor [Sphingomonas morindae]USI74670.1 RNA polymerase sigma factor [Sphingomonas morindae]